MPTVASPGTSRCRLAAECALLVCTLVVQGARAETSLQAVPPDFGEFGLISAEVYQVRAPNGRLLVMRGKLHNPYDAKVEGVRLVVRLLSSGEVPRELDRVEKDLDVTIEPGREFRFNRDVETPYAYVFDRMAIVAFAKRRGETQVPAPSPDVEKQASTTHAVALFTGNIPIVIPVGGFPIPNIR